MMNESTLHPALLSELGYTQLEASSDLPRRIEVNLEGISDEESRQTVIGASLMSFASFLGAKPLKARNRMLTIAHNLRLNSVELAIIIDSLR